jgi:hypothetical protein
VTVASDATVSRLITTLAADVDAATGAIRAARAAARERVWSRRRPLAGQVGDQVIIDLAVLTPALLCVQFHIQYLG